MPIRVEEYVREDGSHPCKNWFDGRDPPSAAKVTTAKLRLKLGNTSSIKWFTGLGECIIDGGPGPRIYLATGGATLIVLFGGATQRGPQRDLDQAKAWLAEYKARKQAQRKAGKPVSGQRKR